MNTKYPYLLDTQFLKDFDNLQLKEQFVKITILDWREKPLIDIQGNAVSGSLNVDGDSSVRRTCNLTFTTIDKQIDITDINNIISINKKVRLEVGFTNTTDKYLEYPILWFPMGVFVIINPSISNSNSGITISLQMKDKMCLLNGECGGVLPASVTFDEYETIDENGNDVISRPTIFQIIQEVVHHFGGEQLGKIIITDLDTRAKQVMKWVGVKSLYVIKTIVKGNEPVYFYTTDLNECLKLCEKNNSSFVEYNTGDDIGYRYVDLTYPSELVGAAGDSVVTILDKIKETLGNFEYFYDLDGNFVFQEKKNFLNTTPATTFLETLENNPEMYLKDTSKGYTSYRFDNANIITSYSNSPQYNMIKNDLIVWGVRKNSDGKEFPIRYHLAIDKKPEIDKAHDVYFIENPETGIKEPVIPNFNFCNKTQDELEQYLKQSGNFKTGTIFEYKKRSTSPNTVIGVWDNSSFSLKTLLDELNCFRIVSSDWRTELFLQGLEAENDGTDSNYYYSELKNEWLKLYDLRAKKITEYSRIGKYGKYRDTTGETAYYLGAFKKTTLDKTSNIDYWLDFIDTPFNIGQLSVDNIGRRTKVLNDNNVNCIFDKDIPDCILIKKEYQIDNSDSTVRQDRNECLGNGQQFCQVGDEIFDSLAIGGRLNSAFVAIQDLLYQHTGYNESISLNCLPIYYLEPNTRIYVQDHASGIVGDYVITSFSLPFDVSSTMTISANKALDKI